MFRFSISNMGCGGCGKSVASVIRKLDPNAEVTFDFNAREVGVATTLNDADRFVAALDASGWKAKRLLV